jgi:hypothetical protein
MMFAPEHVSSFLKRVIHHPPAAGPFNFAEGKSLLQSFHAHRRRRRCLVHLKTYGTPLWGKKGIAPKNKSSRTKVKKVNRVVGEYYFFGKLNRKSNVPVTVVRPLPCHVFNYPTMWFVPIPWFIEEKEAQL